MRLIHYSSEPLTEVLSRPHAEHGAGAFKTPGLWVSAEGDDDWVEWCTSEMPGRLESYSHATEIILHVAHSVLYLRTVAELDEFTERFKSLSQMHRYGYQIDWEAVRKKHHGLIIAPYQWERRMTEHTLWYYGWDCASGVIWDAAAVVALQSVELPKFQVPKQQEAAADEQ